MNKLRANEIAENRLQAILNSDESRILSLLDESEYDLLIDKDIKYQIRTNAFLEDEKKRLIRIMVMIDDMGFWSTLSPVTVSNLVVLEKLDLE